MRIAEVAPAYLTVPPSTYGGTEVVVSLLADGLTARGHDVTLYACGGSRSAATIVSPLAEEPGLARLGESYWDVFHSLAALLEADEHDAVHTHSLVAPALGAVSGARVVHTLHGPWDERARAFYGLIRDRVELVAISESQRAAHPAAGYAATIPNGIDLETYRFSAAPGEHLLWIGRSIPEKAPEVAVEVARRAGLPLKLLVKRAEPHEQEHWRREVEPRLTGREEVYENVDGATKVELLQRARAFLFPIRWEEPFGLVMAEAAGCGTPVVACPRGAARDLVVDGVTGFLRRDLVSLAEAVLRAAELDRAACRAHAEARFSAEAMVDAYEELFLRGAGIRAGELEAVRSV